MSATKPKITSGVEQELDKAMQTVDNFNASVNDLTLDRMNAAPKQESEPQIKLSQVELAKKPDIHLKPTRQIGSQEKFNENWRSDYNFSMEYVYFTAQNNEIMGEDIQFWTKPFPGMPAQEWKVPVNKPVWAPRHVAEQIKRACYHRLVMHQGQSAGSDGMGQYYGTMAVDTTVQRLDALPASQKKSVFMGATNF